MMEPGATKVPLGNSQFGLGARKWILREELLSTQLYIIGDSGSSTQSMG